MSLAQGDYVRAKKGDETYADTFAGRTGVVVRTERQWGGIVAYVRFEGGYVSSFFADGLRRVKPDAKV